MRSAKNNCNHNRLPFHCEYFPKTFLQSVISYNLLSLQFRYEHRLQNYYMRKHLNNFRFSLYARCNYLSAQHSNSTTRRAQFNLNTHTQRWEFSDRRSANYLPSQTQTLCAGRTFSQLVQNGTLSSCMLFAELIPNEDCQQPHVCQDALRSTYGCLWHRRANKQKVAVAPGRSGGWLGGFGKRE